MTNKAAHLAVGVGADGKKEVLGIWVGHTEGAKFWLRVMNDLKARGINDVLIVVCDGLTGLPAAIEAVWLQLRNATEDRGYFDRKRPASRARWNPCGASNDDCPMPSIGSWSTTSQQRRGRIREGNQATTLSPARPAHSTPPALRTSHFPVSATVEN